jgi:formylglycine-generating enzyme required for sulfatase activity
LIGCQFCIDKYEAAAELLFGVAVSDPNAIPWATISFDDATAACSAAGKRICTKEEWNWACSGDPDLSTGRLYPYGDTYDAAKCNGDNAGETPHPASDFPACVTPEGVAMLSGNIAEYIVMDASGKGGFAGGSHNENQNALTCKFILASLPVNPTPQIGFRCCKDAE